MGCFLDIKCDITKMRQAIKDIYELSKAENITLQMKRITGARRHPLPVCNNTLIFQSTPVDDRAIII